MRQFTYTITTPIGIHARPAGMLVETVNAMTSTVTVSKGEKSSPADRLMSLMMLEAHQGDTVTVTVTGLNEAEDTLTLANFFLDHM